MLTKKTIRIYKKVQVAGYKINIQKSVMILYTKNELSEKDIRKIIIIIGALKRIKYLGQFLNFSSASVSSFVNGHNDVYYRECQD